MHRQRAHCPWGLQACTQRAAARPPPHLLPLPVVLPAAGVPAYGACTEPELRDRAGCVALGGRWAYERVQGRAWQPLGALPEREC